MVIMANGQPIWINRVDIFQGISYLKLHILFYSNGLSGKVCQISGISKLIMADG